MRGRGWFEWVTGSAAAQSGSAESTAESTAGYTSLAGPDVAHGPSAGYAGKPEPVSNMPFKDIYGSGTYTGYVVKLPNGFVSRQGNGQMTYTNGTMYAGEYQGNKRDGTGTIYGTKQVTLTDDGMSHVLNTMMESRWKDDKQIDGKYKRIYYEGDKIMLIKSVLVGNIIKEYGLEQQADDATGLGLMRVNPAEMLKSLYPKPNHPMDAIARLHK